MQAERLADAVGEVGRVAVEGLAAADIVAGEVERGLAGLHPFGDRLADAARGLDADRVEAGGDEEIAQGWAPRRGSSGRRA